MARVRYIGNANRFKLPSAGLIVTPDDPEVNVDEDVAEYLLENTDQFERVDSTSEEAVSEDDSSDEEAVDPPLDPSDYTVSELESELDDGDYSDEELTAIATAEANGQGRSGVRSALDARQEE